jgi:hypothetical protein
MTSKITVEPHAGYPNDSVKVVTDDGVIFVANGTTQTFFIWDARSITMTEANSQAVPAEEAEPTGQFAGDGGGGGGDGT